MIYSSTQTDFSLTSWWDCSYYLEAGQLKWVYKHKPSVDSRTIYFEVLLPNDAVISRVWLKMDTTSPLTGCAIKKVNDITIPSSGEVELGIDAVKPGTQSYKAEFAFQANGAIYADSAQHESVLTIREPTICVEYTSVSQPDDGGGGEEDVPVVDITPVANGLKLPRLLDKSMAEVARLVPLSMRVELVIDPKSTAEMELDETQPVVNVGDFVEVFTPHGSAGVFRAVRVESRCGMERARTVYLEHAICTLEDSLLHGKRGISGNVASVFSTLLESQVEKLWVLGECEVPSDYEAFYEYADENLLQAVAKLTADLPVLYMWVFDTSKVPFVMHLRKLPEQEECEGRLSRNLLTATITVDRAKLCTRVYAYGAGEKQDRVGLVNLIGTAYLQSPNADTWGIVEQSITVGDVYDAPTLKDVAQRYLDKYSTPMVSIDMDATDLSSATGESFDRFSLGKLCRLAMPDYKLTVRERVVALSWADVYGNPEAVTVSLANRIRDASDEMVELLREVKQSKLIGGTIETVSEDGGYGSIAPVSPYTQYFDVTGSSLLSVVVTYKCVTSSYSEVDCTLNVDGNEVEAQAGLRTVDITRWLKADENGVPLDGEHRVTYFPKTANNVYASITTTLTVKQIKKG